MRDAAVDCFHWQPFIVGVFGGWFVFRGLLKDLLTLTNPAKRYLQYKSVRGMSYFTDLLDWLGGYPFQVSKPGEVLDFLRSKGFELVKLNTAGRFHGNDEYVFVRRSP